MMMRDQKVVEVLSESPKALTVVSCLVPVQWGKKTLTPCVLVLGAPGRGKTSWLTDLNFLSNREEFEVGVFNGPSLAQPIQDVVGVKGVPATVDLYPEPFVRLVYSDKPYKVLVIDEAVAIEPVYFARLLTALAGAEEVAGSQEWNRVAKVMISNPPEMYARSIRFEPNVRDRVGQQPIEWAKAFDEPLVRESRRAAILGEDCRVKFELRPITIGEEYVDLYTALEREIRTEPDGSERALQWAIAMMAVSGSLTNSFLPQNTSDILHTRLGHSIASRLFTVISGVKLLDVDALMMGDEWEQYLVDYMNQCQKGHNAIATLLIRGSVRAHFSRSATIDPGKLDRVLRVLDSVAKVEGPPWAKDAIRNSVIDFALIKTGVYANHPRAAEVAKTRVMGAKAYAAQAGSGR